LFIVENQNAGNFKEGAEIKLPFAIREALTADLNNDGHAELIFLDESDSLFILPSVR
jgi:hypothetical protein